MKPTTSGDVLDLLDASFLSASLGAAMELGLFWLLADRPMNDLEIASRLGIPPVRCRHWLRLLCRTGLIRSGPAGFEATESARRAILQSYSRNSWALLAEEARERFPCLRDLSIHIREPGSVWNTLGVERRSYVDRMAGDPDRARRFTRMLYELHQTLAEEVARALDLNEVGRLMDLGGGSGVVSMALARRDPGLTATVVDIPPVCTAGREIATEQGLEDRVTYHPADFLRDKLPGDFDMVLECDVNLYTEDLFRSVWNALRPGGRFVIIDQLAPEDDAAEPARVLWAFAGSLADPQAELPAVPLVRDLLGRTGFLLVSEGPLSAAAEPRASKGWIILEARKINRESPR